MKQQAIQYLALDVHQATSVATVRDASGAIRMQATVPTEAKAIVSLVKGDRPARTRGVLRKVRKQNGCTICCSRMPSAWWSATSEAEARHRTRATGLMRTGCRSSCV